MANPTPEQVKAWKAANKERVSAKMKEWRENNKQHVAEYKKQRESTEHGKMLKAANQKRHYQTSVKTDPEKLAKRSESTKKRDAANPEQHKARCDRYKQSHRTLLAEKAKAAYQALSVDERKALHLARAEYQKEYRDTHKEELVEKARQSHAANRDARNAKCRANYQRDKLAYVRRARKRLGYLTGTYTDADIAAMYDNQNGICLGCRAELNGKYEIDHIIALAIDPTGDRLDNLQLLCMPCNRRKGKLSPDVWAARLGKLFV